jgi:hypothetical protein
MTNKYEERRPDNSASHGRVRASISILIYPVDPASYRDQASVRQEEKVTGQAGGKGSKAEATVDSTSEVSGVKGGLVVFAVT